MEPANRIATFDQDGTLWVEHPLYSQLVYCFDRVPAVVKAKPGLANVESLGPGVSRAAALALMKNKQLKRLGGTIDLATSRRRVEMHDMPRLGRLGRR